MLEFLRGKVSDPSHSVFAQVRLWEN